MLHNPIQRLWRGIIGPQSTEQRVVHSDPMDGERWRRVEEIYHQALDLNGPARAGFLQQACAGDDELRAEIESLIGFDSQADPLLEEPAWKALGNNAAAALRTPRLAEGTQLGSYRVIEWL